MKTIVLNSPGNLEIVSRQEPNSPKEGEALVRTRRVGICGTDLHAYQGDFPFMEYPRVLGHELCVEIIEIGGDQSGVGNIKIGDLCAVEPYLNCKNCYACNIGKYNCCSSLNVIGVHSDGGMRREFRLPLSKLHVANQINMDQLAIVEMLSVGAHAVSRSRSLNGQKTLVVGLGPIGLGVANFAKLAGADLMLVDINQKRLDFAKSVLDLDGILSTSLLREELEDTFDGLPSIIFDATGNLNSMNNSFDLVNYSGEIVFVGLVRDQISFEDPHFHSHELTLKASRNARSADFSYVIETLADGRTDVSKWISHRVTPEVLVSDMEKWIDPSYGVIKGVVNFD